MMKANAQSIILSAATTLKDLKGTRWPAYELVQYLNDAQLKLVGMRPDTLAVTRAIELQAGPRQVLPDDAMVFIDITRNTEARMRQITKVDQKILNTTVPTWQSATPANEVKHYMYDLREPRVLMVYPPAKAGSKVEMRFAVFPTPVSKPSSKLATDVTGDCSVGVEWEAALYHFILFRAFSKDAEFGGNAGFASAELGLFKAELGEPLQSAATVAAAS